MTAATPDLPDAAPIRWPVPAWVTDPDTRKSIEDGLVAIDAELMGGSK
ncbi:hypothetical protein ACFY2M_19600 [Streptomyces sp. NPDC001276]